MRPLGSDRSSQWPPDHLFTDLLFHKNHHIRYHHHHRCHHPHHPPAHPHHYHPRVPLCVMTHSDSKQ